MLTSDETATPCVDCGAEMQGIYVKIIGKHFTHKRCDECDMSHRRKTTEHHLSLYRARIPTIMRELCGVPPHFTGATIAQLPRSLSKAAQFPPKGAYLTGPPGTGKTFAGAAYISQYLNDHPPPDGEYAAKALPLFLCVPEFLRDVRTTFSNNTTEASVTTPYEQCPLLVIDDIGSEKATEWSLQTLFILIDSRWKHERQTVVTSNISLDKLADKLSDRIASRIGGMCKIYQTAGRDQRIHRKERT